jgi:hypothetical protein
MAAKRSVPTRPNLPIKATIASKARPRLVSNFRIPYKINGIDEGYAAPVDLGKLEIRFHEASPRSPSPAPSWVVRAASWPGPPHQVFGIGQLVVFGLRNFPAGLRYFSGLLLYFPKIYRALRCDAMRIMGVK